MCLNPFSLFFTNSHPVWFYKIPIFLLVMLNVFLYKESTFASSVYGGLSFEGQRLRRLIKRGKMIQVQIKLEFSSLKAFQQDPAYTSLKLLRVIHLYREDEESSRIDGEQGIEERSSSSTGRRLQLKVAVPVGFRRN